MGGEIKCHHCGNSASYRGRIKYMFCNCATDLVPICKECFEGVKVPSTFYNLRPLGYHMPKGGKTGPGKYEWYD